MEENTRKFTHCKLFAVFALVMGGVMVYSILEWNKRDELESTGSVTALSDQDYFPIDMDDEKTLTEPLLQWKGKGIYRRQRNNTSKSEDFWLISMGKDDSGNYTIYGRWDREKSTEENSFPVKEDRIYLKIGPQEYLRVGDRKF